MSYFGSTGPLIGIAFNSYNFQIDNFGDNAIPRSYVSQANFDYSANGTQILDGPAFLQKYQWVIATVMEKDVALEFDDMFRAWDQARADGLAAAVGIIDQTWGSTVDTNAIFVTPPTYTKLGPNLALVSFGLQEV